MAFSTFEPERSPALATASLGIQYDQAPLAISPDGKSLVLVKQWSNAYGLKVLDISNPLHPTSAAEILPIRIPAHGYLYPGFFQIVGDKLYVFDGSGSAAVLNFNRQTGNFRMRGYSVNPLLVGQTAAFSADGAYLYAMDYYGDSVAVFDTSKLEKNAKDLLLTRLSAPYTPSLVAVSPVAPPSRALPSKPPSKNRAQQHKAPANERLALRQR